MPVIIGVNPVGKRKKKKSAKKKPAVKKRAATRTPTKSKGTAMAKKGRKKGGTSAGKIRYRTRIKNVIKYRRAKKTASKKVRKKTGTGEALNLARIFRASGAVALGMVVAKVAVNKLTEGGSEKMAWTWPNIFMCAGSSVVAAFILGAFGFKKPTVALVAVGGVGLALYKTFTCKIAPKWGWTEEWFGADDDLPYIPYGASDDLEVVDFEPATSGVGATDGGGRLVARNPYFGSTGGGGRLVARNPNMGNDYQSIANRARLAYSAGGMM